MKPLAAIASATILLAFVASASAQRGGAARGGFSAHSAPSFHSSFAPSSRSFSGPAYRSSGPSFAPATRITSASRYRTVPSGARPNFYSLHRPPIADRRRFAPRVGVASPYAYPIAYPGYGFDPGYTDAAPYDQTATQPIYSDLSPQQDVDQQQIGAATPPPASNQRYSPPPQPLQPEEAVTLVFKDGRPSEQIHNYMLTRTMLYVRDQHHRDIPVDQLDLAATLKANQSNRVEFALPTAN